MQQRPSRLHARKTKELGACILISPLKIVTDRPLACAISPNRKAAARPNSCRRPRDVKGAAKKDDDARLPREALKANAARLSRLSSPAGQAIAQPLCRRWCPRHLSWLISFYSLYILYPYGVHMVVRITSMIKSSTSEAKPTMHT
jgi:hypothetical protein